MARIAEWIVHEVNGKQHRIAVERVPLLGIRVSVDRRRLERFDQTATSDRYVTSTAGHVVTAIVPRASNDQPTLTVDGKAVLGSETTLAPAESTASASSGTAVSGHDLLRYQLQQRRGQGGAWFYWIGGASILNSLIYATGTQWGLAIGLGVTYVIDEVAKAASNTVRTPIYAFLIDIAIACGFLLLGRASRRGALGWWAFGIFLYLLDGILFVIEEDVLGIVVHLIALGALASGWIAARRLKKMETPAPALVG